MSMSLNCPACGKNLTAPESAAGQEAQCPGCGHQFTLPAVPAEFSEEEREQLSSEEELQVEPPPVRTKSDRHPCPFCGEMIRQGAAKCRHCGEVFDPTLRKQLKGKTHRDEDADLSGADWALAIICSSIGCIMGIAWLIQGKPKGGKMLCVSILASIGWTILRTIAEQSLQQH